MTNNGNIRLHFAHANGFPAASYTLLLDSLSTEFNVLALDKFAHNPVFPLIRGWGNQVDELVHFLTEKQGFPCYLVGHSFGAVVSYMAACLHPDKVKGLIMLDPPLFTGVTSALARVVRPTPIFDRITPARQTLNRCTRWPKDTDLVAYFQHKTLFKNMHPTCIKDYTEAATIETENGFELDFDHRVEANIFRTIPLNISSFYGKLTVPAVLITGEKTTVCKPHLIAPFIRDNRLAHKVVKNGGHMFPLEQPILVAQMIKQQLTEWQSESSHSHAR